VLPLTLDVTDIKTTRQADRSTIRERDNHPEIWSGEQIVQFWLILTQCTKPESTKSWVLAQETEVYIGMGTIRARPSAPP
jgi:hypothetical protein